ncbi:uncharacterized protein LOC111907189 [Lactuca sativa]|uniref:uncharacterized protein LOC111907189 n=1 Tax=Lactuca sativa TaxID=4236 RepID=UPI000CD84ECD|nr:uncharacterized protein LOC111907189 [Lactuca sativa]
MVKGGKGMHGLKGPKPNVCALSGKQICNNLSLKASVFAKLRDIRTLRQMIGLPCCAWNEDVVSMVASMCSNVCFLDDDGDDPLAMKRLCSGSLRGYSLCSGPNAFLKSTVHCTDNVVIVGGVWFPFSFPYYMVNIYAPQGVWEKFDLWQYLKDFKRRNGGNYMFFGDFNVVREGTERMGSVLCPITTSDFNDFIDDMGLIDVPMIGKRFTRIDAIGSKLSKPDRFLVDEAFYDRFDHLQVSVLDRRWFDYCHIFLHVSLVDYGPSSFKFFNSWLELDGFNDMVKEVFKEFVVDRSWSYKEESRVSSNRLLSRSVDIDKTFDDGGSCDDLARERRAILSEFCVNPWFPIGCNSSFITLIPKIENLIRINDYRPISLIGIHFEIIAKLLANRLAPVLHDVIGLEPSAFLNSSQILDGPLLVNEMVRRMMFLGFGERRRAWIRAMFSNACSSVHLNVFPADEFQLFRGLRQGDPLSPFLFIIAMEGLHISMEDAVSEVVFRGGQLESHDLAISHLFYADGAIFLGEWNENNVRNLIRVLGCCSTESFPFVYLGVPVGESLVRVKGWKIIIDHFKKRLASWQARLLFIGVRLSLVKSVLGSLGIYYLSTFRPHVAVLQALENMRALFFGVWKRRKVFLGAREYKAVVVFGKKIVGSINHLHGSGLLPSNVMARVTENGATIRFWHDVWCLDVPIMVQFGIFFALASNQSSLVREYWSPTSWVFAWHCDIRGGVEQEQLASLMSLLDEFYLGTESDKWFWNLDNSGCFSVKSTRSWIDDSRLPSGSLPT